jgi:N-acetylglutamate synthase-like GNAT family acetyltransferase
MPVTAPLPLRRAGASDASAIRALSRLAYAKWVPVIGREPLPMIADYDKAVCAHMIDLYEEHGALIALIEMIAGDNHLLIENIAVHPARHCEGLGDAMLAHAIDVARSLELPDVRLYTNAAFTANLEFYARRGFSEFQRENIASDGELVRMRKAVTL